MKLRPNLQLAMKHFLKGMSYKSMWCLIVSNFNVKVLLPNHVFGDENWIQFATPLSFHGITNHHENCKIFYKFGHYYEWFIRNRIWKDKILLNFFLHQNVIYYFKSYTWRNNSVIHMKDINYTFYFGWACYVIPQNGMTLTTGSSSLFIMSIISGYKDL